MKYAFFSDVHANLEALQAVIGDMEKEGVDRRFFLGDAVGYGPNPNECVELIDQITKVKLAGNHDWAVLGKTDITYFNEHARDAINWTKEQLTKKTKETMLAFALSHKIAEHGILLVHSTPQNPEEWNYILSIDEAKEAFDNFTEQMCFIGHSHQPIIFYLEEGENYPVDIPDAAFHTSIFRPEEGSRYIINIGSVGQPRDFYPQACYVIYDTEKNLIKYKRVEYDIKAVQKKMGEAGLPEYLINRLAQGR